MRFFFDEAIREGWEGLPHAACRGVEADHGRLETRRLWATRDVAWLRRQGHDWPGLRGIVCVECERLVFGQEKPKRERRHFITSLDPRVVGAEALLDLVRGHWEVENKAHWSLDVTFREDQSRVRKGHGAENLSRMRRLALNLVRHPPDRVSVRTGRPQKTSLKLKRLMCDWDTDYLLSALTKT